MVKILSIYIVVNYIVIKKLKKLTIVGADGARLPVEVQCVLLLTVHEVS